MFRQIYAQRGVAGLYAGIIPEYAKVVPGVAIAFCSYEVHTELRIQHRYLPISKAFPESAQPALVGAAPAA